jgi:membrane associated rhomboid family serine protease
VDERTGADGGAGSDPGIVRATADRRAADEWLLVLTAEGFRASVHHASGAFAIRVPTGERKAAALVLEQYELENLRLEETPVPPPEPIGNVERLTAALVCLALVAFAAWTGPRDPAVDWFARGSADAAAILDGELWRTLTALCLHADWGHVLSNALFGALFLSAAAAGFGPGVAVALTVAAGAGGNLANAIFQGPDHLSVGASTSVFGAVGLLCGRGVAQRLRRGELGVRLWVPIAAGLAIIAMLGTGERSDLWAHLFGFLTGGFLGIPASLAWPRSAAWPVQLAALAATAAALLWAWRLALA